MKNKRVWLLRIIVAIVVIIAVILVLRFKFTYVGENGLKAVIITLIPSLIEKILTGACMGITVVAILTIIFGHLILKVKTKQVRYTKDMDKCLTKFMIITSIILSIVICVFFQFNLTLHNMQTTEDFKFANDIVLLVNAILDLHQKETYDISAKEYSYLRLNIKKYRNTTSETYIKFDDGNYIIVGKKDKKFIKDNWNEDGDNTVTLYKNSGIICKINGKSLN